MNKTISLNRTLINLGTPLALLGVLILIMQPSLLKEHNSLDLAITIDLLITIPLVYFLLIRKSEIPKTTVVPMTVIGLLVGSYFLPPENQTYLTLFKTWAIPLIEFSILAFVIIKVHNVFKTHKTLRSSTPDFYDALKSACHEILPKKLVLPFATEVAVIYYGLINWKARPIEKHEFTYHKKSGTPALMGAFILIIGVETIAFHLLLARWNDTVAWILTALSAYTALQVFGFAKSLSQRPISINKKSITLKYGILNEVEILFADINDIELSRKPLNTDPLTKTLSPFGAIESHNVIIHLKKAHELVGLYGIKRKFTTIGLYIDHPKTFKERIATAIQQQDHSSQPET